MSDTEETVAWLERRLDDGMNPVYLPAAFARSLIADWRKRGEALANIGDADQVEMALDPEWPSRVARAALSPQRPPPRDE